MHDFFHFETRLVLTGFFFGVYLNLVTRSECHMSECQSLTLLTLGLGWAGANFDLWGVAEKRRKKRKKKRKKRKKKEGFSTESWVSKLYPFWVFFGDNCSYFLALYPGFGQS